MADMRRAAICAILSFFTPLRESLNCADGCSRKRNSKTAGKLGAAEGCGLNTKA